MFLEDTLFNKIIETFQTVFFFLTEYI